MKGWSMVWKYVLVKKQCYWYLKYPKMHILFSKAVLLTWSLVRMLTSEISLMITLR